MTRHELRQHSEKMIRKFISPISEAELACRIIEAVARIRRPAGSTPEQCLDSMDAEDRTRWRAAAVAAMEYWRECIAAAQEAN
jgi:hypothetical protein